MRTLSRGRYDAVLHANGIGDLIGTVKKYYTGLDLLLLSECIAIIKHDIMDGHILSYSQNFFATLPNIWTLANSILHYEAHAVVCLGRKKFINCGSIVTKSDLRTLNLNPIPLAVLEVVRTKRQQPPVNRLVA